MLRDLKISKQKTIAEKKKSADGISYFPVDLGYKFELNDFMERMSSNTNKVVKGDSDVFQLSFPVSMDGQFTESKAEVHPWRIYIDNQYILLISIEIRSISKIYFRCVSTINISSFRPTRFHDLGKATEIRYNK